MRKANASESTITATLTPTSVGLRFSMREQGIVFEVIRSGVLSRPPPPNTCLCRANQLSYLIARRQTATTRM
jgi:hypothetical protein